MLVDVTAHEAVQPFGDATAPLHIYRTTALQAPFAITSLLFQHIPSVKLNHLNVCCSMDLATAFAPGGLGQEEMVLSTMELQRAPTRTNPHQCLAFAGVVMELLSCADRP